MNNHKILWKLKWIQILLCIVPLFVPSWTKITYNEANVTIFDRKSKQLESVIMESLQTTKNFYASPEASTGVLLLMLAGILVPLPGLNQISGIIFVMNALLAVESDWRKVFSKTIAQETERSIASFFLQTMTAKMKTIEDSYELLRDNDTSMTERIMDTKIIHKDIDEMLNYFDIDLFKTYPLLAVPPIIQLAQLIDFFEPIAKIIIPKTANRRELSCKMLNILLDFQPRAIIARLEKMHLTSYVLLDDSVPLASYILSACLRYAMSREYYRFGYSMSIPPSINCTKGCAQRTQNEKIGDEIRHLLLFSPLKILVTKPHTITQERLCLKDDFGADEYLGTVSCMVDYALLLRHRVEEMFRYPIWLLETSCVNPPQKTGFGWLTIKLRYVRAHRKGDMTACDSWHTSCDPFVRLFINGDERLVTLPQDDTCCYDLDVTFTSHKISKSALIKIEVKDADDDGEEELILRTEGDVNSFLRTGHRSDPITFTEILEYPPYFRNIITENSIDTISVWKDEYEWLDAEKDD